MPLFKIYNTFSSFQRVIIALTLGILSGIFFGEVMGNLEIIGNAYIRLLQMTVLPYVLVSIIGGLGRLDSNMASTIGTRALKIILVMWGAVMCTLLFLPIAYPNWETANFFSSSATQSTAPINFLELYIPSNIFLSLAGTIVPAVVLFSLLMGIALINVKNKEVLLTLTSNVGDSLMKVASYVAKLAPLGIFAISSSAAGTLEVAELGRLQVFLWVYIVAGILLAFVFLPLVIHFSTPFTYRQVLSTAGEACITALATGTVLVVLPMITERCKELLAEKGMECEETNSTVDVMVPTAYSFPSTGTLLGLGFILFSAWYVGSPLGLEQYVSFVVMGALTAFGSMAVAIPFLLNYFDLPADQFQLYLLGSVVTARVATGLAALHGFVVTLLVASSVMKKLSWPKFMQAIALHLGITFAVVIGAGITLTQLIPYQYEGVKTFESMQPLFVQAKMDSYPEYLPLSQNDLNRSRIDVINERGSIRVGYFSASLPYAFRNSNDKIVGFEIEMVHELARDLDLSIELIYIKNKDRKNRAELLANGSVDLTVGGQVITPKRALSMAFSVPYTHHTGGLLVLDSDRDRYSTVTGINQLEGVNLGITAHSYYSHLLAERFPNAKFTVISDVRQFLKGNVKDLDAFVYSAEAASAWSMLYPEFSAIIPKGFELRAPIGLVLPKGDVEFAEYLNTWLVLKKDSGFIQQVYNYWILGQNPKAKQPRWSVANDVLGWNL